MKTLLSILLKLVLKLGKLIMLQAVVYYIVIVIFTKELVIATDQCTEYQFTSPFTNVGESCEDIYNKNPESHQYSGYYWIIKRVFCGMTYTGSSCEHIYNKYPEIYKNKAKDKSGYYYLNNKQWTYCNMTEIAANDDDFTSTCAAVEVIKSTYQSFLPGESCESIYNNNIESHEWSGYYWITSSRVYCGMNYTGSSCEDIKDSNPEIGNKSGYYRTSGNQWTYCDMSTMTVNGDFISTCAGVGGGWKRIANINISAGDDCPGEWRKATHFGISFCRVASDDQSLVCSSANFSTNGISYQRVCGRARGYQYGETYAFYGSIPSHKRTIDESYASGLSITYSRNPRQHIWTFASGSGEIVHDPYNCPCSVNGGYSPSSFVGNNYYCESAPWYYQGTRRTYFFNDTLWDGEGCVDHCCDDTTQPWFYRHLNQTTQDDIEARICTANSFASHGSTLIDQLELYIQ